MSLNSVENYTAKNILVEYGTSTLPENWLTGLDLNNPTSTNVYFIVEAQYRYFIQMTQLW